VDWTSGGDGSGNYRYLLNGEDFERGTPVYTTETSYVPKPNLDTARHSLYVQERDSVGNWSPSRRIEFTAVRYHYLQCKVADGIFVLTMVPDSNKVRLERFISAPKDASEKATQMNQLWMLQKYPANPSLEGYAIRNPFNDKIIRSRSNTGHDPVTLVDLKDMGSSGVYRWYPPQYPQPVEETYQNIGNYQFAGSGLRAEGPPWDERSEIDVGAAPSGFDNELWRWMPYTGARFVR
jgi:hypothetical protein